MGRGGTRPYHVNLGRDDFHVVPLLVLVFVWVKKGELKWDGVEPVPTMSILVGMTSTSSLAWFRFLNVGEEGELKWDAVERVLTMG